MNTTSATPAKPGTSMEMRRVESLAQLRWTAFILFFFVLQAILWTVAITLTSNDPSHVVLDEYGSAPEAWKERMAIERASAKLGWQADVAMSSEADIRGRRSGRLRLSDSQGQPIAGGKVTIKAFHTGHAAEAQSVTATEGEPGVYEFSITVRNYGNWRFEGDVNADSHRFVFENQIWLDREGR